ncbi:uncharacterized protein N7473_003312 [Penicillium subrubescens]|uniref:uncharacterized protein n=1 Tax=Penicillium subrubescens TaxID=1316194 RepID=UPI002545343F|nr:uncharacterized protein N7473_003312 [Penicillium subrubescens]KAJ5906396.1 hypothetical protein N7473_003312 [Penicillium subrubescens]
MKKLAPSTWISGIMMAWERLRDHWPMLCPKLVCFDSLPLFARIIRGRIPASTIMYLGALNTGYATSFFTPSILRDMGWTSLMAQVMSIPIYVVAAIMTLCTAILSQETKRAR